MPFKRLSVYEKKWKLVRLSDICQRVQTKNAGGQCRQVLTIAAQHGLVNQEDFFNKTVASENLEGYYLLRKGDFAYNKSYSGNYTWGAVKRLQYLSCFQGWEAVGYRIARTVPLRQFPSNDVRRLSFPNKG